MILRVSAFGEENAPLRISEDVRRQPGPLPNSPKQISKLVEVRAPLLCRLPCLGTEQALGLSQGR